MTCMLSCFSCVWLCMTPWTVACQASLSMRFSGQEYWSGLPFPSPGDLPWPRDRTWVSSVSCTGRWILYHWDISRETQGPFLQPCLALITSLKIFIYSHTRREGSVWIWGGVGGHNSVYNKGIVSAVDLVNQSFNSRSSQIYSIYFHRIFLSHISFQWP